MKGVIKKGAFEMSFVWIFAIIIGAGIIFLAVYFSVKLIGLGETQINAQTSEEIGILLNPLETNFESTRASSFSMPVETRIYSSCDEYGNFGRQLINVSQKSFNKWTETDLEVQFLNKYLFNEEYVEGKKFNIFSKPFEFPFKVADLICIISAEDGYCFSDAPEEIKREIENLNQKNLQTENCSGYSKKICFESGTGCDVFVDYQKKIVQKGSEKMYFEGDALMYAAIFSNKEIYECQIKRLAMRISQLTKIYQNKILITSRVGCSSNLDADLSALRIMTEKIENSANLGVGLKTLVDGMTEKNKYSSECKLW